MPVKSDWGICETETHPMILEVTSYYKTIYKP